MSSCACGISTQWLATVGGVSENLQALEKMTHKVPENAIDSAVKVLRAACAAVTSASLLTGGGDPLELGDGAAALGAAAAAAAAIVGEPPHRPAAESELASAPLPRRSLLRGLFSSPAHTPSEEPAAGARLFEEDLFGDGPESAGQATPTAAVAAALGAAPAAAAAMVSAAAAEVSPVAATLPGQPVPEATLPPPAPAAIAAGTVTTAPAARAAEGDVDDEDDEDEDEDEDRPAWYIFM